MRTNYLLFILILVLFGYFVQADSGWYDYHSKFANDTANMLVDFDKRLTAKDDLMKRALDSYGTQVHVNKEWIKKTRSDISDKKGLG